MNTQLEMFTIPAMKPIKQEINLHDEMKKNNIKKKEKNELHNKQI